MPGYNFFTKIAGPNTGDGVFAEYFKTKEQFSLHEFTEEIMHHPEVVDSFVQFIKNYEVSKQFEMDDEFVIDLAAVKKLIIIFSRLNGAFIRLLNIKTLKFSKTAYSLK